MLLRSKYQTWMSKADIGRLVFIDEAGSNVNMTRAFARACRGVRAVGTAPRGNGQPVTMIGALRLDGISAMMTVEGGTNEAVFLAFVNQVLGPTLRKGDIVVLDNLSAHKTAAVRAAITSFGAIPWFLPPWSPDLNPIELAWSKIKSFLRTAEARSLDSLNTAIAWAMELVTPDDALAWINHCGYLHRPR